MEMFICPTVLLEQMKFFHKTYNTLRKDFETKVMERLKSLPAGEVPPEVQIAQSVFMDAKELYAAKTNDIMAAFRTATERFQALLEECLVDWKPFVVDQEDSNKIMNLLIVFFFSLSLAFSSEISSWANRVSFS